jgi:nitroreductase
MSQNPPGAAGPAAREAAHQIDPLFTRRWSPRAFTDATLDEPTLLSFLEAARWAPSGYNAQPWRFIYGRRGTPGWQTIFDTLSEYNGGWAQRASALVAILSRTVWLPPGKTELQPVSTHSFDAGAAWASLAFQATLSGWHAHGIGGFDKAQLRVKLDIPADYAIEAVIAIGKVGDKAVLPEALQAREAPNQRWPLSELVADGRFAFDQESR